jgi:hypothetical protein
MEPEHMEQTCSLINDILEKPVADNSAVSELFINQMKNRTAELCSRFPLK